MPDDRDIQYNAQPQAVPGPPLPIETIAARLFQRLDDCDTADDIAKSNDALFRHLVRQAHQQRFKYATTDGYDLKFNTKK